MVPTRLLITLSIPLPPSSIISFNMQMVMRESFNASLFIEQSTCSLDVHIKRSDEYHWSTKCVNMQMFFNRRAKLTVLINC